MEFVWGGSILGSKTRTEAPDTGWAGPLQGLAYNLFWPKLRVWAGEIQMETSVEWTFRKALHARKRAGTLIPQGSLGEEGDSQRSNWVDPNANKKATTSSGHFGKIAQTR